MRQPTISRLRRSIIEVERKFQCNRDSVQRFRLNKEIPAFQRLEHIGKQSFEDIYFDYNNALSTRGIWVRKRNENWQAKIRQSQQGSYTNSQFEELSTPAEIGAMIKKLGIYTVDSSAEGFGLNQLARFTTFRETWKVNDKFEVVFDMTDFGHSVGEVELQQSIEVDDDDRASVTRRTAIAADMDRQIEEFMKKFSWAFPADRPVGKLSAYFARKR